MQERSNLEHGYEQAIEILIGDLAGIENIEKQCLKCGAELSAVGAGKAIFLTYFSRKYRVLLPDVEITLSDSGESVSLKDRVLILHYLTTERGNGINGALITFKELPQGINYFPVFYSRAIKPLLNNFGETPERLLTKAADFSGRRAEYGDVSVTVDAFSRVPITLVMWRGDEEFAPEGNILFDSSITDYLSTYAITELCETLAWRLIKG